jgi:hypothetical protein
MVNRAFYIVTSFEDSNSGDRKIIELLNYEKEPARLFRIGLWPNNPFVYIDYLRSILFFKNIQSMPLSIGADILEADFEKIRESLTMGFGKYNSMELPRDLGLVVHHNYEVYGSSLLEDLGYSSSKLSQEFLDF